HPCCLRASLLRSLRRRLLCGLLSCLLRGLARGLLGGLLGCLLRDLLLGNLLLRHLLLGDLAGGLLRCRLLGYLLLRDLLLGNLPGGLLGRRLHGFPDRLLGNLLLRRLLGGGALLCSFLRGHGMALLVVGLSLLATAQFARHRGDRTRDQPPTRTAHRDGSGGARGARATGRTATGC